jgi:hypothetical protein
MAGATMRLVRLPGPGSVGEQEAYLLEALAEMAAAHNALIQRAAERRAGPKP